MTAPALFESIRGQLVVLLHRDAHARQRIEVELLVMGYSVLTLASRDDLVAYLDGAAAYDARVAFPDLLVADELTIGVSGLLRLEWRQIAVARMPVLLLTDGPLSTEDRFRATLGVTRVLRRPYTRADLIHAVQELVPMPYTDEPTRH